MLSVCIITKNEERHLERCLSSVREIASEIIVVDSGSTDSTVDIALSFQCKVLTIDWIDDYSFARNHGISQCVFPWILCVDADETLENPEKLLRKIKSASSKVGGFVMSRLDEFVNLESGKRTMTPIGLVRLFRNQNNIRFQEPVHEIVGPSVLSNGFKLSVSTEFHLRHHIVEHSRDFLIEKQSKYLKIINKNIELNPNNLWMWYQKAKTKWFLGEEVEAQKIFKYISEEKDHELAISSLNNLATLSILAQDYQFSRKLLNRSLTLDRTQSQAKFIYGDLELKLGNTKQAFKQYSKVKDKLHLTKVGSFIPGGLFLVPCQRLYRMALCFYQDKSFKRSMYLLNKSIGFDKAYVDAFFLRSKILLKQGDVEGAILDLDRILSLNPEWTEAAKFRQTIIS